MGPLAKSLALAAIVSVSFAASSAAFAQGAGSPLKGPNGDGTDASPADTYRGRNSDQDRRPALEERNRSGTSEDRQ
jgi:hypothetical protein